MGSMTTCASSATKCHAQRQKCRPSPNSGTVPVSTPKRNVSPNTALKPYRPQVGPQPESGAEPVLSCQCGFRQKNGTSARFSGDQSPVGCV
ncbi:hypothetical protein BV20DRAFT_380695 [Pilatotrama ljubarskyi]|nr:hypothetical protein BV20DRAFT_380695 [Pilatotrama ljubarskyi]